MTRETGHSNSGAHQIGGKIFERKSTSQIGERFNIHTLSFIPNQRKVNNASFTDLVLGFFSVVLLFTRHQENSSEPVV